MRHNNCGLLTQVVLSADSTVHESDIQTKKLLYFLTSTYGSFSNV